MQKVLYGQKNILTFNIKYQNFVLSHKSLAISLEVLLNFENFMLHLVEGGVSFSKKMDEKLDFHLSFWWFYVLAQSQTCKHMSLLVYLQ